MSFGKKCDGLNYFPHGSNITLDRNNQTKFINNFDKLVPKISKDLGISEELAFQKFLKFLSDTQIIVQPTGL